MAEGFVERAKEKVPGTVGRGRKRERKRETVKGREDWRTRER